MPDDYKAPKTTVEQGQAASQPAPETPAVPNQPPAAGQAAAGSYFGRIASWFKRTFPGRENAVLFGLLGLIIAVLIFVIGIWRSSVIAIFVVAGVAIGQAVDGDPKIVRAIQRFISSRRP